MIPLKLCWGWTIWKAQGQTFNEKIVIDLGKSEKEHGLSYTGLSRSNRFTNIGLPHGVTKERICNQIAKGSKLKLRKVAEIKLDELGVETEKLYRDLTS